MSAARRRKRAERKWHDRAVPKETRIAHRRLIREMIADGRLVYDTPAPGSTWYYLNPPTVWR